MSTLRPIDPETARRACAEIRSAAPDAGPLVRWTCERCQRGVALGRPPAYETVSGMRGCQFVNARVARLRRLRMVRPEPGRTPHAGSPRTGPLGGPRAGE